MGAPELWPAASTGCFPAPAFFPNLPASCRYSSKRQILLRASIHWWTATDNVGKTNQHKKYSKAIQKINYQYNGNVHHTHIVPRHIHPCAEAGFHVIRILLVWKMFRQNTVCIFYIAGSIPGSIHPGVSPDGGAGNYEPYGIGFRVK